MTAAGSVRVNKSIPTRDHELPEGWILTTIGEACDLNPPKPPSNALHADAKITFVPMPAVDADSGTIAAPRERPFGEARNGYTAFREGDVIMAKITPCMENGKAAVAHGLTNGLGFGSTEFHVLRPNGVAVAEYLFYYIRQESFRAAAEAEMTGSVGQRRVPAEFLDGSQIPIPPRAEQDRIVAQIDALLRQVDASRERLAKVPALLKRFRQSVLAAACSGRLTGAWRTDLTIPEPASELGQGLLGSDAIRNPGMPQIVTPGTDAADPADLMDELPEGWVWRWAGEFYEDARYGTSVRCDREHTGGIPVLRIPNVAGSSLDLSDLKYAHVPEQELAALFVREGDLIVCRTNGSLDLIGKAALIPKLPRPYAFASYLIRLRLDYSRLLPEYFHICLSSPIGRHHIEDRARTTAGQFNLNLRILREFAIPVPPLAQQHEIVRRVEALFKLADTIEQRVARATARAEKLTQAILARAFRGELVPTEAELARREGRDYEPAARMLKHVTQERRAPSMRTPSN